MSSCKIDGCDRTKQYRGWCGMHYKRWRKHGDPGPAEMLHHWSNTERKCKIEGCKKIARARGWCDMHYIRWWLSGAVGPAKMLRRQKGTGTKSHGYIRECKGTNIPSIRQHRRIWEEHYGPIPKGYNIHHINWGISRHYAAWYRKGSLVVAGTGGTS